MDDEARRRAVELVLKITNGAISEGERDEAMRELERLVPDPGVSDLILWPANHPLSAEVEDHNLTPELIVELASQYRPLEL
ncbi:MAG: hypothetical protein GY724_14685 [Actinomycetia bacterium]|nr:hypothetical protein [Actinomycetes bacterium]MCP5035167.1 hypothetical protein [Actinomycetes bacterium]